MRISTVRSISTLAFHCLYPSPPAFIHATQLGVGRALCRRPHNFCPPANLSSMNSRSPKRKLSRTTDTPENPKRMRQSTLPFAKSANSAAASNVDMNRWNEESPNVMIFETEGWYEKATADEATPRCIAAFDLDSTLIKTKSGAKFARNATDLVLWSADVLPKLQQCVDDGCVLVIFSNQHGVSKGRPTKDMIRARIHEVANTLDLPIAVYMATGKDRFRKPCIGMWELFISRMGGEDRVNKLSSFFVGDAAGRKRDFSDSDLKFAINIELTFHTPENFFKGTPYTPSGLSLGDFNPHNFVTEGQFQMGEPHGDAEVRECLEQIVRPKTMGPLLMEGFATGDDGAPKKQTMVILVGSPASGKSTFSKRYLTINGYVWVNNDSSTTAKALKAAAAAIAEGKSVVVDNTNGTKTARAKYLEIAKKQGNVAMYCLKMETPKNLAMHLNVVREILTSGAQKRLAPVAFNMYFKRETEPDLNEGFDAIGVVEFKAHFSDAHDKFIFTRHS